MSTLRALEKGLSSCSAEETEAIAAATVAEMQANLTVALHGDLGVGKTTFVRGLARGIGITATITSPTFNILAIYEGETNLVHLDAYRLSGSKDFESLMLDEFLRPPYCFAIEWPANILGCIPRSALHIRLSILSPNRHWIRLM